MRTALWFTSRPRSVESARARSQDHVMQFGRAPPCLLFLLLAEDFVEFFEVGVSVCCRFIHVKIIQDLK